MPLVVVEDDWRSVSQDSPAATAVAGVEHEGHVARHKFYGKEIYRKE